MLHKHCQNNQDSTVITMPPAEFEIAKEIANSMKLPRRKTKGDPNDIRGQFLNLLTQALNDICPFYEEIFSSTTEADDYSNYYKLVIVDVLGNFVVENLFFLIKTVAKDTNDKDCFELLTKEGKI